MLGSYLDGRSEVGAAVTVRGFQNPEIQAVDIADPKRPVRLGGLAVEADGAGYRVSFAQPAPGSRWVVFAASAVPVLSGEVVTETVLADPELAAEYVIVVPAGMESAARELADYRVQQGLSALMVTVESIYRQFGDDTAAVWPHDLMLVADTADAGGDSPGVCESLASQMPAGQPVLRVYLGETDPASARAGVLAAWNEGTRMVLYAGHGGFDRFGRSGILTSADVPQIVTGARLPVVFAVTCVAGQSCLPGQDCLAEELVRKPDGGSIAVIAPSTLAYNDDSAVLAQAFFAAVFTDGTTHLGDAMLAAETQWLASPAGKRAGTAASRVFSILGDPATRLRVEER